VQHATKYDLSYKVQLLLLLCSGSAGVAHHPHMCVKQHGVRVETGTDPIDQCHSLLWMALSGVLRPGRPRLCRQFRHMATVVSARAPDQGR
jgi:hypothetical protein